RMSLILAQYDLTFSISAAGDVIKFIPLPAAPVLTRTSPVGANLAAAADRAKRAAPAAECSTAGAKLTVTASAEDQDRVAAALKGASSQKTAAKETKKIDKLAAQNVPVGKLLTALGQKLDLKVELDEAAIRAAGISLDQLVSVNVQNGTLDDVFRAATMRTGLGYRLHEKSVEVFPVDKK
ncbi:MAG TPA: hypothetical protein VFE24_14655, partial [Pirellulales bacterium]|nr:hypothetical protein [Pirellulales bacterium]